MGKAYITVHPDSKHDIKWFLDTIKELKGKNQKGKNIAQYCNSKGMKLLTKRAPSGRGVNETDVTTAWTQLIQGKTYTPPSRKVRPSRKKAMDFYDLLEDVMSSNLEKDTKRVLSAILSREVGKDAFKVD